MRASSGVRSPVSLAEQYAKRTRAMTSSIAPAQGCAGARPLRGNHPVAMDAFARMIATCSAIMATSEAGIGTGRPSSPSGASTTSAIAIVAFVGEIAQLPLHETERGQRLPPVRVGDTRLRAGASGTQSGTSPQTQR